MRQWMSHASKNDTRDCGVQGLSKDVCLPKILSDVAAALRHLVTVRHDEGVAPSHPRPAHRGRHRCRVGRGGGSAFGVMENGAVNPDLLPEAKLNAHGIVDVPMLTNIPMKCKELTILAIDCHWHDANAVLVVGGEESPSRPEARLLAQDSLGPELEPTAAPRGRNTPIRQQLDPPFPSIHRSTFMGHPPPLHYGHRDGRITAACPR